MSEIVYGAFSNLAGSTLDRPGILHATIPSSNIYRDSFPHKYNLFRFDCKPIKV